MPCSLFLDDERLERELLLLVERGLALLERVLLLLLRERVPVERDLVVAMIVTPFPSIMGRGSNERRGRKVPAASQFQPSWPSIVSALEAEYSPGASTFSCSTTPSLTIIE